MSGWWIWISVGGLVGSGMVILGLRKRYVGDHPHCRKCGFDLFGRNESSVVCSECGADLNARKAIVIGVGRGSDTSGRPLK